MLTQKEVNYIENMADETIKALKLSVNEYFKGEYRYIYTSQNRAKFKRLRVELTKELLKAEHEIYKG